MNDEVPLISLGDACVLNLSQQELIKDGLHIPLSTTQCRLLYYLGIHMKKVVTSHELISYAWGEEAYINRDQLYIQINRLRKHLEVDPKNPVLLISLRGLGYMLFPRSN